MTVPLKESVSNVFAIQGGSWNAEKGISNICN